MVSGRPRARGSRSFAAGTLPRPEPRAAQAVALCAAIALACTSCLFANGDAAFSASLSQLDAALSSRDLGRVRPSFTRAVARARKATQWLSLLKRSGAAEALGDLGRYASVADRARKAFPKSESIAAAAAFAYARGGRPLQALALFAGPLSPDARPSLWAEAFLAAVGSGASVVATAADYARLAEATGDPRALLGAAELQLAAGRADSARAWVEKAVAAGAQPPIELLWDCGLYAELAARSDLGLGAGELAVLGDAAWISGDRELAALRWKRSIAVDPRLSWKPYANLALAAGDGGDIAASYWSRMKAAFLSGPPSPARDGALAAYAAHLARLGDDREALDALAGGGGAGAISVMALSIEGRRQPEARFVAAMERLVAAHPGDPAVRGAALRALSVRGKFGEMAALLEDRPRGGPSVAYGWFYEASVAAARGDFKKAVAIIEAVTGQSGDTSQEGPPYAALAAYFALGSLYGAMGNPVQAAADYTRAVSVATSGKERCSALKGLGQALGDVGDREKAAEAFRAAAAADPSDPEAAILARSASTN